MGIDLVDLVMTIEETFSIEVPKDSFEYFVTVGDTYDFISEKLNPVEGSQRSISDESLDRICKALEDANIKQKIKPGTELKSIMPSNGQRKFWSVLQEASGLTLPRLIRPNAVFALFGLIAILGPIPICLQNSFLNDYFPISWLLLIPFSSILACICSLPLARIPCCKTMKDLSESAAYLNVDALRNKNNPWTEEEIWIMLRRIVVNTLGVDPDEVTRDAHYVRDLGAD